MLSTCSLVTDSYWGKKFESVKPDMGNSIKYNFLSKEKDTHNIPDEIDNPHKVQTSPLDNAKLAKYFEPMKHEGNRLNSFSGKWPLRYIKAKDLAAEGFFYLQTEDKVQCAFCRLVLHGWNVGDTPMREHIKNSPKCPFLLSSEVGNIPLARRPILSKPPSFPQELRQIRITMSQPKPKCSRMADIKNRLLSFKSWPLVMMSAEKLAECGLYYTGVSDVVTCFYCGGSLGNWELDDDPWKEHKNFFSDCHYLAIAEKVGYGLPKKGSQPAVKVGHSHASVTNNSAAENSDIISQASQIFPRALVQEVVSHHRQKTGKNFTFVEDLCKAVMEFEKVASSRPEPEKQVKLAPLTETLETSISNSTPKETSNILLCKICMDNERGILFQPCGHLVSCLKCSLKLTTCPVCRTLITGRVRTYLS